MKKLCIVAYKRTPFGAFGATLVQHSATDLSVLASETCLKSINLSPTQIDSAIIGNVCQSSPDAIYLARHVALKVGMPIDRHALTVNRLCGSGFEAVVQGAYQILNEGARCVLVGGTESMSQTPYVLRNARFGYRLGNSQVEDFLHTSLTDSYTQMPMAMTAERVGEKYKVTRADVDDYALLSQQRHEKARASGVFENEIAPIEVKSKKGTIQFSLDEHARAQSTIEGLAKLPSLFKKDGLVTAGNSSGICDGAASLLIADEEWARAQSLPILGRLLNWSQVGCAPEEMGMGPAPAIRKVLEKSKNAGRSLSLNDIDLVEVNEAFAAQYIGVERELELDRSKTNIHGGAIAIGHPLAASGARLTGHVLMSLARENKSLALASACIGGGQGMALLLEKV